MSCMPMHLVNFCLPASGGPDLPLGHHSWTCSLQTWPSFWCTVMIVRLHAMGLMLQWKEDIICKCSGRLG